MSKIIAILPVKNEEWILPTYLKSMEKIADQIIAFDDHSSDKSIEILKKSSKVKTISNNQNIKNMSDKRRVLLDEGREQKGTHFICLDADEIFSSDFQKNARKEILSLNPGQKLLMQWIPLWKSIKKYRDDESVWSNSFKDIIFADDKKLSFKQRFLSESRTPGENNQDNTIQIPQDKGVVLHFQFVFWDYFQIKQAWYRCLEKINTGQSPQAINATYSITLDVGRVGLSPVKKEWMGGVLIPKKASNWRLSEIVKLFSKHGILYFEDLDIWHVKDLREEFENKVGRSPQSKKGFMEKFKKIFT